MKTQIISVDLPADILLTLNETESELKKNIKCSLAAQLYREQKLTIGKAAEVAGLSRIDFETLLSEINVPISNLSISEVLADIEKLK